MKGPGDEWFGSVTGLHTTVMVLAWQHRSERPLILVRTSPGGADALDPSVTMTPQSPQEQPGAYLGYIFADIDEPDVSYLVSFDLQHPGAQELAGRQEHIQLSGREIVLTHTWTLRYDATL